MKDIIKITIDGKEVDVLPEDKNIVDAAERAGIVIPAPCYRDNRKGGCCKACVVEIDGKQGFACGAVPRSGMQITVAKNDLENLRKERLKKYKDAIKSGAISTCSCFCNTKSNNSKKCC